MLWQRLLESPEFLTGFVLLVVALVSGLTIVVKAAARAAVNATELRLENQRVELEAKIADNELKQAEAFTDQAVMRTMTESAFNLSSIMQQLVQMQKMSQNQIGELQRAYIAESAAWREVVTQNRDKFAELSDTTSKYHAKHEHVIQKLIERIERLLEKIQLIIDTRNANDEHKTPKPNNDTDNTADAAAGTPGDSAGRNTDEHPTNGNGSSADQPTSTDVF